MRHFVMSKLENVKLSASFLNTHPVRLYLFWKILVLYCTVIHMQLLKI